MRRPHSVVVDSDDTRADFATKWMTKFGLTVARLTLDDSVSGAALKLDPDFLVVSAASAQDEILQVVRKIRSEEAELGLRRMPIIVIAPGRPDARMISLSLGADEYLPTPFSAESLRSAIEPYLAPMSNEEYANTVRAIVDEWPDSSDDLGYDQSIQ